VRPVRRDRLFGGRWIWQTRGVSWLLLVFGVLSAMATLNAFWPVRTPLLAIFGFFAGWLTIELALHSLVVHMTVLAWLCASGGLAAWPGIVGLVLALAACVGLFALHLRSRRAVVTLREFYESAALEVRPDAPRYPRSHVLIPWLAFHRRDIRTVRDVTFAEVDGKPLKLDVFSPKAPGRRRPALLQVHGGGWLLGFKEYQGIPLLGHMAAQGWVGFNVDYRLSPRATFPAHIIDVKRALAWIREHADEYGVDPDFIVVTGGSAGGHLAALLALTPGDPEYQPGFESADTSVRAAIVFYGIFDMTDQVPRRSKQFMRLLERWVFKASYAEARERYLRASPTFRIHPDAPTFLVVHGTRDTLTPVEDARTFVERLRAVSRKPALYIEMQGAEHAFDVFPSVRNAPVIEACERFLSSLHAAYAAGRTDGSAAVRTVDAIAAP
jgi:acetyl esterase/lipase